MQIEVISDCFSELGESPVWDDQHQSICWVDILRGKIWEWHAQADLKEIDLGEPVGCIALGQNSDFIAALSSGTVIIDRVKGTIKKYVADPEALIKGNRANDGKCDPRGRFWYGTMSMTEAPGAGSVYMLSADDCQKKIKGVSVSNGMAWNLSEDTFYYIDTPSREVVAYDYDAATGNISGRRRAIDISEEEGFPDGMTIDMEGMLWIALWDGWKVVRYNPRTGKKLDTIQLPVARVTSCTFGGTTMGDLYITSAKTGLNETEQKDQPLAGALFRVSNCGFSGMPPNRYPISNIK